MRRKCIDHFAGLSVNPPTGNAAAWKHERMRAVPIDNGQFEIPVEGCCRYSLPHVTHLPRERPDVLI